MNILRFKEFILEKNSLSTDKLPSFEHYKNWVLGFIDEETDDIACPDEYIDISGEIAFKIAALYDMIEDDYLQYVTEEEKEIDFVATMNDILVFAEDEYKNKIVSEGEKILKMTDKERENYFKSLEGSLKFNL